MISELANLSNVVFFVEGLRWGDSQEDRCTYRILNKSREFFIENQIRVVFWLTENEAIDLAHFAPDYWSFRHRVIEFVDPPRPDQTSPQSWSLPGRALENLPILPRIWMQKSPCGLHCWPISRRVMNQLPPSESSINPGHVALAQGRLR